jgi:hypothetical protein
VLNFASLSSVLLFLPSQGLPQEYIILFRRPNHQVHGTAFSSLTGIAGGFINYNNSSGRNSQTGRFRREIAV